MTRAALIGGLAAFALALSTAVQVHAAPTAKQPEPPPVIWPQEPCNLDHRMDIAIIDGLFFECNCSRLLIGYQCDWLLIAGVPSASSRKIKRPRKGLVIRMARPAVVR